MGLLRKVETFKIGDRGSKNSGIEIIAVHSFKKFHLERHRAHLEKLITAALRASGANASPEEEPRVSYYAVDSDDFSFYHKSSSTARFVKDCQNLAKNVKSLLGYEPSRSDKRLIFVACGLGAALTKYCLANQYDYHETITKKTTGVVFLDSWPDSMDRDAITEFVDGWIQDAPDLVEHDEVPPIQDNPGNIIPDNMVDRRRSMQVSATKAKKEFLDLLCQVDDNFRAIMNTERRLLEQDCIDGRVLQLPWLGRLPKRKILAFTAPVVWNEDTKNGLTDILKFLRDARQSRDDLPPELKRFRYFTGQYDSTELIPISLAEDASVPLIPADEHHKDIRHGHNRSLPRHSASRRSFRSRSTQRNMSRRAQSSRRPEEEQIPTGEQMKLNPKAGESALPGSSMETATSGLYQRFVDMNAPCGPNEGKDRISSTETLRRLAAKAASYVELGELDNADKVYEQVIRLRQAVAPGDSHLFVLHLRRAKVWHEMGRYEKAKTYFSSIQEAADSVETSQVMAPVSGSLARDLDWYDVLTRFRLGDHIMVDRILADYLQPRVISQPCLPWDENIQIVFRSKRILALNKAKMGHFGEAKEQIDQLHIIVRKLDLFISPYDTASHQHLRSQSHESPPQAANDNQQPRKASALLAYTSALVLLLRGQHKTALTESHQAVQLLRKTSGENSLDALEARSLEAYLLAYNCQPVKADTACKESLRSVSRNFGAQHPLSLETIDVLVFILRRRARLSEALVTAQGLCRQCEQVLGPGRPQTRQSKSQLASIHLSNGNYRDAVKLLQEITPRSTDEYSSPNNLRYHAELALTLFRFGKFEAAAATIQWTILSQKILFSGSHTDAGANEVRPGTKFEDELADLTEDLRQKPGQVRKYMLHPDLLYSLEVLAHITSRTNLALAVQHLELVLALRESNQAELSSDQYTTEKTRLDAILMKRELGANDYSYPRAERELTSLTRTMHRILGPYHADTIAVRSELLLTRAILGQDPRASLTKLIAVERQQMVETGKFHPDTLRTRLAILVVQLLLGDTQAAAMTCRGLLEALRAPEVRSQRLVEALAMEERVAVLYANQRRFGECRGILEGMVAGLEGDLAQQVEELGLDDMVARVKGLLNKIRPSEAAM